MSTPRRSASAWTGAAWLLLALACPCWGQIDINYSRLSDSVTKALVGTIPKDVSLFRADVLNVGTSEARLFPARVGFEAAATAPMQDPEAAIFAAQNFRNTRWWVVGLQVLGLAARYAMPGLILLNTLGVTIPDALTGTVGSFGGASAVIEGARRDATKLPIPATWLRDGLPEIILRSGEPVPYLLALGGKPPLTFSVTIPSLTLISETRPAERTHPMVDDEMAEVSAHAALVRAMILERSALGVSQ